VCSRIAPFNETKVLTTLVSSTSTSMNQRTEERTVPRLEEYTMGVYRIVKKWRHYREQ